MKNYYFILSLNIDASEGEIKQAFRKLALQFHPDKNKSPEAEAIIKEVNEAYEVLGDPVKKMIYDQMLRGNVVAEEPKPEPAAPAKPHRDPRYRPKPAAQANRRPSKREELLAMMASNLHYARLMSKVALVFCAVLLADYSLPARVSTSTVVGEVATFRSRSYKIELSDGKLLGVSREALQQFTDGMRVFVYRSALFNVPLSVEDVRSHDRLKVDLSIYGNFIFGPVILLLTSLIGSYYWKGVEFRFNLGIMNFLLLMLNLIFLQIHKF